MPLLPQPEDLEAPKTHHFKVKTFKKVKPCGICRQVITREGCTCKGEWLAGPWGRGACLCGNERLGALAGLGCPWGSKWVPGSHLGGEAEHTDGEHVGVCEWHMAGDGWHGNSM